ncbi:type 4a pilus biogenesis protein PilO [Patescibacteria group bacterium]
MLANKQFYISVGILLLATVGLFLGVVLPSTFTIRELRDGINGEHAKIQDRYHRRGQLKETLLNLNEIKGGVGSLTSVAIKEGEALQFVQALEEIATRNGVEQEIQLRTVNQTELSDWELEVPITIIVEGEYVGILNYMRELESLPYYIIVNSFNVSSTGVTGGTLSSGGAVSASMTGTIYWITDDIPAIIDSESL